MARFVHKAGGTVATLIRPHLFREETRRWYCRVERSSPIQPVEVKLFDSLLNAINNTAVYAASGTATVPAGSTTPVTVTVPLTDNVAVTPTFTGAQIDVTLPSSTSTLAAEVYECDLGQRLERTVLRVVRALSFISQANNYFINPVLIERGLRQFEDAVGKRPYIGVSDLTIEAEKWEIGNRSIMSTLSMTIVAHQDVVTRNDVADPNDLPFYHDIRRALRVIDDTPYDGAVNDGRIYDDLEFSLSAEDGGILTARDRASIEGTIRIRVHESDLDVLYQPRGFIMRQFANSDITAIKNGSFDYGAYDGFIFGSGDWEQATVEQLVASGKKRFYYANIIFYPFSNSAEGDSTWQNFFRSDIQQGAGAWYAGAGTTAGIFPYNCISTGGGCLPPPINEYHALVRWDLVTAAKRTEMVNKLMQLTRHGVFLDQAWLEPPDFFWAGEPQVAFPTQCGAYRSCFNAISYTETGRAQFAASFAAALANQVAFIAELQTRLAVYGGYAIANGRANLSSEVIQGTTIKRPVFLENAADVGLGGIALKLTRWRDDPRNVIELKIAASPAALPAEFAQVRDEFGANGGWVCMNPATGATTQDANITSAYAQLAAVRPS